MQKPRFTAYIGNDPIADYVTRYCATPEQAARAARPYAKFMETITVIGPRGGKTEWEAVGNNTVWKK